LTPAEFKKLTGEKPNAGKPGHKMCGVCSKCDQPVFMCGCIYRNAAMELVKIAQMLYSNTTQEMAEELMSESGKRNGLVDMSIEGLENFLLKNPQIFKNKILIDNILKNSLIDRGRFRELEKAAIYNNKLRTRRRFP